MFERATIGDDYRRTIIGYVIESIIVRMVCILIGGIWYVIEYAIEDMYGVRFLWHRNKRQHMM